MWNDGPWNKHKARCTKIKKIFKLEHGGDRKQWEAFLRPATPPPETELDRRFIDESKSPPMELLVDSDSDDNDDDGGETRTTQTQTQAQAPPQGPPPPPYRARFMARTV
ncbi:hypothetical protein D9758_007621 [Tetrapyrgos nigripes]|uniref:Uncharacterized protein n=1 Tax=Tetrapyrgos nigripes TaxID=182062 RepID=A0A8H5G7Y6_9AGAR|nr:hypothetical protein D9758_007621 [Tetrapyrgos nigripes]